MPTIEIKIVKEFCYVYGLRRNNLFIEEITNIGNFCIFRPKQCIIIFANKLHRIIGKDKRDLENIL